MAFNIRVPNLTGDYKKDIELLEKFMKEINLKLRLMEQTIMKEIKNNGK